MNFWSTGCGNAEISVFFGTQGSPEKRRVIKKLCVMFIIVFGVKGGLVLIFMFVWCIDHSVMVVS